MLNKYYCRLNITLYFEYRIREALLGKSTLIMSVFLSRCIISSRELKYTGEKKSIFIHFVTRSKHKHAIEICREKLSARTGLILFKLLFSSKGYSNSWARRDCCFFVFVTENMEAQFCKQACFCTILDQKNLNVSIVFADHQLSIFTVPEMEEHSKRTCIEFVCKKNLN